MFSHHTTPEEVQELVSKAPSANLKRMIACEGFIGSKLAADNLNALSEEDFEA